MCNHRQVRLWMELRRLRRAETAEVGRAGWWGKEVGGEEKEEEEEKKRRESK